MRHLLLFRHAEAAQNPQISDRERPLTAAGRLAAARVGAHLAEARIKIDLVLISDATRTRETWEAAAAAYGARPHVRIVERLYRAERGDLMEMAREFADSARCAIILGHNPALGEFAWHFAGSGDAEALARMRRGVPPAALARFDIEQDDWRKLRWGDGALVEFLT
jgi:phosphohistidine phosphatase